MASISETGHAKNVANFQTLISFVSSYGERYNPSKPILSTASLTNIYTLAQNSLENVTGSITEYNNTVNDRLQAFTGIRTLSTRLVNALAVTEASTEKVKDAKGFNRKLQGRRPKQTAPSSQNATAVPNNISTSQNSYDQQVQQFAGLISVLESEPTYTPNEGDLKTSHLNQLRTNMLAQNGNVSTAYTNVSNHRINRDNILYNNENSLVHVATEVKQYIKSAFGSTSPQYNQVKGILFKKFKR